MGPFDDYPNGGRKLLGKLKNKAKTNSRHGYGLELSETTGQTACAYCGVSFIDDYYHWLLMTVDHVIPQVEAQRLGIPEKRYEDITNLVLACSGCNGFDNQFKIPDDWGRPRTLSQFYELRDKAFEKRRVNIEERRSEEMQFFDYSWRE